MEVPAQPGKRKIWRPKIGLLAECRPELSFPLGSQLSDAHALCVQGHTFGERIDLSQMAALDWRVEVSPITARRDVGAGPSPLLMLAFNSIMRLWCDHDV